MHAYLHTLWSCSLMITHVRSDGQRNRDWVEGASSAPQAVCCTSSTITISLIIVHLHHIAFLIDDLSWPITVDILGQMVGATENDDSARSMQTCTRNPSYSRRELAIAMTMEICYCLPPSWFVMNDPHPCLTTFSARIGSPSGRACCAHRSTCQ